MPPLRKKTRRIPRSGKMRSRARRRPSRSRQRQMARSASGVRTTTWSIAGASAAAASTGRAPSCTARPWKASGQPAGRSPTKRTECTPGSPDSSSTAPHPSWKRRTSPASRTGSTPRRSVYAAVASSRSATPIWTLSSSMPSLYHILHPKAGGCEGRRVFSFALSEEERLIQETARRFAHDRLRPGLRAHERARGVPGALVAEFAALGLDAVDVPAGAGGQGLGAFAKCLVLEELAAVDPGAAVALDGAGLALPTLAEGGLEALIGELRREPGHRGVVIEDVEGRLGVRDGRLVGEHPWVPADAVAVAVVFHPAQAFVVREGFGLAPIAACGLEAAGAARLIFDHAPIAATLEEPHALARARARTRTSVAALLVGAARGARAEWEAASALAEAAEQALFVGPNAVQVLGGHGFMKDHPVEKWMRDIRTLAQMAGGRDEAELAAAALAPEREVGFAHGPGDA